MHAIRKGMDTRYQCACLMSDQASFPLAKTEYTQGVKMNS
jgi:hypothetical protein